MSLDAEVQTGAVKAAKESGLIPKGNYEFTIAKGEVKVYGDESSVAGKRYLNLQLRVVDDWPTAKGRTVFLKVPLFSNWNPSAKYPDGFPTNYAEFFLAIGVSEEVVESGKGLPGPSEFGGKRLAAYVNVKPADDFNDSDYNEVGRISKPKTGTPAAVAEIAGGDVWGTTNAPTQAPVEDVWGSPAPSADPALAQAAATTQGF
jgi:hypothetical protein